MKASKVITSILMTLLSIYPLFTIFIYEGEVYAKKGLIAGLVAQLTFLVLFFMVITIYFISKINIYVVYLLSIANIILNLCGLGINWLHLEDPKPVYIHLITIVGISILYILCKHISLQNNFKKNCIGYIPLIIIEIILGLINCIFL